MAPGPLEPRRETVRPPLELRWRRIRWRAVGGWRLVGDAVELPQPGRGLAVAGRAPVAPRRQRAARADLRRIGNRAPLELAELEEPIQERPQVRLDLADRVLVA